MMDWLGFAVFTLLVTICDGFYNPFRVSSMVSNRIWSTVDERFDFSNNIIDITPKKDGGILKKMISRGNGAKGYPQDGDLVLVDWVFYDEDRNMIHDSIDLDETFHFTLGVKYQVIDAFDIAVRTMYEGETAMLRVTPEYGFGVHGEDKFKPNQTLIIEFTLEELVVGLRQYETVSEDYDITKEIQAKIDSGELNIDDIPEAVESKPAESETSQTETWTETIPEDAKIPAVPMPFAVDRDSTSHTKQTISPQKQDPPKSFPSTAVPPTSPQNSKRRFFDPTKDKLHPDRTIRGVGEGHLWDETVEQLVLEVSIPEDLEKNDLNVEIRFVEYNKCFIVTF